MNKKLLLFAGVGLTLVIAYFVATQAYKSSQQKQLDFLASENAEVFVREHSPRFGPENAKVILTEFLDPECESCRNFYPVVKNLLEDFGNKVQLVVRYAPFHPNSKTAIKALEAARVQNKYWEALELLFFKQPEWGNHHNPQPELIFEYLPRLGLDMDQLKADMESQRIQGIIMQDEKDLQTLNVRGTPTFFVNGEQLQDFSAEGLKNLLEEKIKEVY